MALQALRAFAFRVTLSAFLWTLHAAAHIIVRLKRVTVVAGLARSGRVTGGTAKRAFVAVAVKKEEA